MLISLNPYKTIPLLYAMPSEDQLLAQLSTHMSPEACSQAWPSGPPDGPDGQLLSGTKPRPHLFTVASSAFGAMASGAGNQSIIVNGESGAGKTEACKVLLRYLAAVSAAFANREVRMLAPGAVTGVRPSLVAWRRVEQSSSTVHVVTPQELENQVLGANPILESFGNAKTIRNDNSSRFGKFVKVSGRASRRESGSMLSFIVRPLVYYPGAVLGRILRAGLQYGALPARTFPCDRASAW